MKDWTTVAVSNNTHTEIESRKQVRHKHNKTKLENFNDVIRRALNLPLEDE